MYLAAGALLLFVVFTCWDVMGSYLFFLEFASICFFISFMNIMRKLKFSVPSESELWNISDWIVFWSFQLIYF